MKRLHRWWNMFRWGSPRGPAVAIDWERHTITYYRMPRQWVRRLHRWVVQGMKEEP